MNQSFLDSIPAQFRAIYEKGNYNPNAAKTQFKVAQATLDFQEKVRKTSVLYPIFGEELFRCLQPTGALALDIRIFDLAVIRDSVKQAVDHTLFRHKVLTELGDGHATVTHPETGEVRDVSFEANALATELKEVAEDLWLHFEKAFPPPAKTEPHDAFYPPVEYVGVLKKEERNKLDDLVGAARGLMRQRLRDRDMRYIHVAVRSAGTFRHVKTINWANEL